jgi:hypothetical protein
MLLDAVDATPLLRWQFHHPVAVEAGDVDVACGIDRHAFGAVEGGERQLVRGCRADQQHASVMQGSERGAYGEFYYCHRATRD